MKKTIGFITILLLALIFAFADMNIYASEIEELGPPNLDNATLLMKEETFFTMNMGTTSFDDTSEHSPYGGYTLDFETNVIDDYHVYFVGITTHLFVKWLPVKGETFFFTNDNIYEQFKYRL